MKLRNRIEAIMKSHAKPSPAWLGKALLFASRLYGLGVRLRTTAYDQGMIKAKRLPCVVISIGNLTLGGSGKTPLTIYIAKKLNCFGYRVAVVSRGYGGTAEKSGAIVSDGSQIFVRSNVSGDEPYMMARQLSCTPILVGANRYQSGSLAVRSFSPDVILLDDGFQHRSLARDLDLVLLDANEPAGNGYLFPRGVLREPLVSIRRGHAVVLTRAHLDGKKPVSRLDSVPESIPVFVSRHDPSIVKIFAGGNMSEGATNAGTRSVDIAFLKAKRALAFSGLAANENFFQSLRETGCLLVATMPYRDHHRYRHADISRIRQTAEDRQVDLILTTEKDYYRLPQAMNLGTTLAVVGVDIKFPNEDFDNFLAGKVAFHLKKKRNMRTFLNGS